MLLGKGCMLNFSKDINILTIAHFKKPERKTPIEYTNAYIWNLERW